MVYCIMIIMIDVLSFLFFDRKRLMSSFAARRGARMISLFPFISAQRDFRLLRINSSSMIPFLYFLVPERLIL